MAEDKSGDIRGDVQISNEEERQYHINLAPGEVAPYIIIVGDPNRATKTSKFLTTIQLERKNREFWSYSGEYHGTPITVLSTGIGTDNVEIAVIELAQIVQIAPTILRVGSCGALQDNIELGDLVVSTGAVRLENTSLFFVDEGYSAIAHYEVVMALSEACERLNFPYHQGLTASASGFYGAQGRNIPGFPLRYADLPERLRERNVLNFEMESSTLFTLGTLRNIRTGTICAVYANRFTNKFITTEKKQQAETHCIRAGLEACKILAQMDKIKKDHNFSHWLPSLKINKKYPVFSD
ncbi:MAG: nucleoside phosphorylase [Candidatus Hermodarchaeota archaeon]